MIFQHTWEKVLSGEKTQTRRLALPEPDGTGEFVCEMLIYPDGVESVGQYRPDSGRWHTKWQIGKTYSVCPVRGKKSVGRIKIVDLRREDVRTISHDDVEAEGFESKGEFLLMWCKMHDKDATIAYPDGTYNGQSLAEQYLRWYDWLSTRPAECYQAWVIEFELEEK